MKSLIAMTLLCVFSLNSSAQQCYKELCHDNKVMDIFGWSGYVVSFDTDKDLVQVELEHGPGTYSFPYNELGKSVECFEKICIDDYVVDKYNEVDVVLEVYNHGKAKVFSPERDGVFILDTKNLRKL